MSGTAHPEITEQVSGEETALERVVEIDPEALDAAARAGEQAVEGLDVDARWALFARELRLALSEDEARIRRVCMQEMYLLSLFTHVDPEVSRITEHETWRAVRDGSVAIEEWIRDRRAAVALRPDGGA